MRAHPGTESKYPSPAAHLRPREPKMGTGGGPGPYIHVQQVPPGKGVGRGSLRRDPACGTLRRTVHKSSSSTGCTGGCRSSGDHTSGNSPPIPVAWGWARQGEPRSARSWGVNWRPQPCLVQGWWVGPCSTAGAGEGWTEPGRPEGGCRQVGRERRRRAGRTRRTPHPGEVLHPPSGIVSAS